MSTAGFVTRRPRPAQVMTFAVVTALVVYFTYERWARYRFVIDDAFISHRYAANLVDGHGLVFNPGERVEGYTNFLWVLLGAGGIASGADPQAVCVAIGVGAFLLTVVLCSAIAFFSRPGGVWAALPAVPMLCVFVLAGGFAAMAGTGLETPFVGLLLLGMGVSNHLWPPVSRLGKAFACVLPLLAVLTRLDALLAVAASALVHLFQEQSRRGGFRRALGATLARFSVVGIGLFAFLAWKLHYYGSVIPLTYYAKGSDFVPLEVGMRYAVAFLRHAPWVLLLTPIVLWAALVAPRGPARSFVRYALLAVSLHAAYVVKVGGDFMHYRFFWEVTPLFVAAAAIGLSALPSRFFALVCAGLVLPLVTVEGHLELQHEMHSLPKMDEYTKSGIRVGRALATLPKDTLIATTMAGTVGYYSRLRVIDEWGLNDRHVAMLRVSSFGGRGHVKRAPVEYLQSRGVNLVVGHPSFVACDTRDLGGRPTLLLRTGDAECVVIWYLTQTPALSAELCNAQAAGSEVRLHLVPCPQQR